MSNTTEQAKRKFNLMAKKIFHDWINKAIKENDRDSFKECVLSIGSEWHVARTVEKDLKDEFIENLWNSVPKIKSGEYDGWTHSQYDAYSYESKVCFLINPLHYKLIYDSNNQEALKCFDRNTWQTAVDDYYEKHIKGKLSVKRIFKIDFDLWNGKKPEELAKVNK